MTTPSPKKLFSLTLAFALCLPAVPASAADPAAGSIDLRLEQALARGGATFELEEIAGDESPDAAAEEARPAARPEAVDLSQLADDSRMREAAAETWLINEARGDGGFGRWLKKYWYVPVLAAAAVVALTGDDSEDPNDPED